MQWSLSKPPQAYKYIVFTYVCGVLQITTLIKKKKITNISLFLKTGQIF